MVKILLVPLIFLFATLAVWLLAAGAPEPELRRKKGKIYWTFPTNFDNATDIAADLQFYKDNHYNYVVTLFVAAYLYKQSFAIPGSFFLVRLLKNNVLTVHTFSYSHTVSCITPLVYNAPFLAATL